MYYALIHLYISISQIWSFPSWPIWISSPLKMLASLMLMCSPNNYMRLYLRWDMPETPCTRSCPCLGTCKLGTVVGEAPIGLQPRLQVSPIS